MFVINESFMTYNMDLFNVNQSQSVAVAALKVSKVHVPVFSGGTTR